MNGQEWILSDDGDLLIGNNYIIPKNSPKILLSPGKNKDLWSKLGGSIDSNGVFIIPKEARYGITQDNVPYVKIGNYYFTSRKISDAGNQDIIPSIQKVYLQYQPIAKLMFDLIEKQETQIGARKKHEKIREELERRKNVDPSILNSQELSQLTLQNYYNDNKEIIDNYTTSNGGIPVYLDLSTYNRINSTLNTFNNLLQFSEDTDSGKYNNYILSLKLNPLSLFNVGTGGIGGMLNTYASFGGFGVPGAFASNLLSMAGRNNYVYDINNNKIGEARESLPIYTPSSFLSNLLKGDKYRDPNYYDNHYYWTGEAPSLTNNLYLDIAMDLALARRPMKPTLFGLSKAGMSTAMGTGTAYGFDEVFDTAIGGETGRMMSALTQQTLIPIVGKAYSGGRKINGVYNPLWFFNHRVVKPLTLKYDYKNSPYYLFRLADQKRINLNDDAKRKVDLEYDFKKQNDFVNQILDQFKGKYSERQKAKRDALIGQISVSSLISKAKANNEKLIHELREGLADSQEFIFYDPLLHKSIFGNEKTRNYNGESLQLDHPWHPVRIEQLNPEIGKNRPFALNPSLELVSGVSNYVSNLLSKLVDRKGVPNGVVVGSSVLKANGLMSGVPHDVELLTTEARLPELLKLLGGNTNRELRNSSHPGLNFGVNVSSKLTFGVSGDDILVIKERNGKAYGAIARELYMTLDPEGYYKWTQDLYKQATDKSVKTTKKEGLDRINDTTLTNTDIDYATLPISAEELYKAYADNPDLILTKTVLDQLSSVKDKHVNRSSAMFLNNSDIVEKALNIQSIANTGKPLVHAADVFPNLDLSDTNSRRDFLESINMDPRIASNDKAFNLVLDRWLEHNTLAFRGSRVFTKDVPYHATLTTALGGGTSSGIGGNNALVTLGLPAIGADITHLNRFILTNYPERVKSLDLLRELTYTGSKLNSKIHLKDWSNSEWELINNKYGMNIKSLLERFIPNDGNISLYDLFDRINLKVQTDLSYEPTARKLNMALSEMYDIPAYRSSYSYGANYIGALTPPEIINRVITGYPNTDTLSYRFFEFGKFPETTVDDTRISKLVENISHNSSAIENLIKSKLDLSTSSLYKKHLFDLLNPENPSDFRIKSLKIRTELDKKFSEKIYKRLQGLENQNMSYMSNQFLYNLYEKYPFLRSLFKQASTLGNNPYFKYAK